MGEQLGKKNQSTRHGRGFVGYAVSKSEASSLSNCLLVVTLQLHVLPLNGAYQQFLIRRAGPEILYLCCDKKFGTDLYERTIYLRGPLT